MLVKEYLESKDYKGKITFIKARARKDNNTPYYHQEYQTTPMYNVDELGDSRLLEYIVLNDQQAPIDWISNQGWTNWFNKGMLKSMLIISKEDLELLYPNKEQRDSLIKSIDSKLNK